MIWVYLLLAIGFEVVATSALKASESFTRLGPSIIVVVGYAAAFYLLSLTLRTIPVGIVYAIWSGAGIVLISLVGWIAVVRRNILFTAPSPSPSATRSQFGFSPLQV